MAEQKIKGPAAVYLPESREKQPGKTGKRLKLFAAAVLLLTLIGGGFFLGVYLKLFDTNQINEKMELYTYPVIGQYFAKPAEAEKNAAADIKQTMDPKAGNGADSQYNAEKAGAISKPVLLTKEQIDKQLKAKQAEDNKRISKLARLYGQMKPQEAAGILEELDDDMVVAIFQKMDESQTAKILAAFTPDRSASLTRLMYNGKPTVRQVP